MGIMLVLVWQTIFVFKNTKDHKNVKFLEKKKENKATPFVILAFLVYTFNINAMCQLKTKKDHIKMSKRGQSRFSHDKFIKEGRKKQNGNKQINNSLKTSSKMIF